MATPELWQRDEDHSSVRIAFSNVWTQLVVSQHSAGLASRSEKKLDAPNARIFSTLLATCMSDLTDRFSCSLDNCEDTLNVNYDRCSDEFCWQSHRLTVEKFLKSRVRDKVPEESTLVLEVAELRYNGCRIDGLIDSRTDQTLTMYIPH